MAPQMPFSTDVAASPRRHKASVLRTFFDSYMDWRTLSSCSRLSMALSWGSVSSDLRPPGMKGR